MGIFVIVCGRSFGFRIGIDNRSDLPWAARDVMVDWAFGHRVGWL